MPILSLSKNYNQFIFISFRIFLELFIQNSFFTISIFAASQIKYGKGKK